MAQATAHTPNVSFERIELVLPGRQIFLGINALFPALGDGLPQYRISEFSEERIGRIA
jgi:hypothetical protein